MASAKTTALYQKDGSLHKHTTTLSSITPFSKLPSKTQSLFKTPPDHQPELHVLVTPETIFHAQGGGQPSDTGTMSLSSSARNTETQEKQSSLFEVQAVRWDSARILHLGVLDPPHPSTFAENVEVTQSIEQGSRLLHSRLHTAGHALGLAVMSLTTGANAILPGDLKEGKASHFPSAASVEFVGLIPGTAKQAIQDAVDALIARDCAVSIHFVDEEEALRRCGAVAAGVKGDEVDGVRVVEVEGAGAYPCGGTHVGRLGEVGRCVVKGVKRQKGVSKVSYDVADA